MIILFSFHPLSLSMFDQCFMKPNVDTYYIVKYSVELRELEAKLKAGYMNRERAAQLAEKHLLEIEEQVSWSLGSNWLGMVLYISNNHS